MKPSDIKVGMQVKTRATVQPFGKPHLEIPKGTILLVKRVRSNHFIVLWKGQDVQLTARHVEPA